MPDPKFNDEAEDEDGSVNPIPPKPRLLIVGDVIRKKESSSVVARQSTEFSNKEPTINSYNLSRSAIAFIWLYHGLIPKLIFQHATELELVNKGPLLVSAETTLVLAGIGEVLIGIGVLIFWRQVWPVYLSLVGFIGLLVASVAIAPGHAVHAFNPVTLTVSAILFCLIQFSSRRESVPLAD